MIDWEQHVRNATGIQRLYLIDGNTILTGFVKTKRKGNFDFKDIDQGIVQVRYSEVDGIESGAFA